MAAELPVARVVVDVRLAHLDRPFDFLVPHRLAEQARPGVRVRVRFSGRLVDGYLLERADSSDHGGRLAFLDRVVSAEPVLTPAVLELSRRVAEHYAGGLSDVLRLAVPPRHARAEAAASVDPPSPPTAPEVGSWERYDHGGDLISAIAAADPVRAVWTALPGPTWPDELARLLLTAVAAGRGALAVLPDHRDVARLDSALGALGSADQHVLVSAQAGPAKRYQRWLQVLRGQRRLVIGTRAAMFAPVADLGLAVVWDDGDDLHAEPRAPYPHVRTVLGLRAELEDTALVVGGLARTAEAALLVSSGWARSVAAPRAVVRRVAPAVRADDGGERAADVRGQRLPTLAWQCARAGLEHGPVLVQVPRGGYLPGLACVTCRRPARCPACSGPLGFSGVGATVACRWCAASAPHWRCPTCDGDRLRSTVVGAGRTAEELAQVFPRTPVRSSGGAAPVLDRVGAAPELVVATPGAEPVADEGYAAALLLDGWALLSRADLRAGEETLRRWMAAAALVRSRADGGQVVVVADPGHPVVQALVRWDPAGLAQRELSERAELRLPPQARLVSLTGDPDSLTAFVSAVALPPAAELLGPVDAPEGSQRLLARAPREQSRALVGAVRAAARLRSPHKDAGPVRIHVDPAQID